MHYFFLKLEYDQGKQGKSNSEVIDVVCLFSVFATLLGDTILIDDLDSANDYRRGVRD